MIDFRINGLEEAIQKIDSLTRNIETQTPLILNESARMLLESIKERAPNDEYASSLIVVPYSPTEVYVGPTIEWAYKHEVGRDFPTFDPYRCPWWRYVSYRARAAIPGSNVIQNVVQDKFQELGTYIYERLRSIIGRVL